MTWSSFGGQGSKVKDCWDFLCCWLECVSSLRVFKFRPRLQQHPYLKSSTTSSLILLTLSWRWSTLHHVTKFTTYCIFYWSRHGCKLQLDQWSEAYKYKVVILFLVCTFFKLILHLRLTHIETHFTERLAIALLAKPTQLFLQTSFVTVMKQPWLSWGLYQHQKSITEGIASKSLLLLRPFQMFTWCACVCMFGSVIFALMPGTWMDSNTLICLDPSPALHQTQVPVEPKTRHEQVLLYIQRQISLELGGCRLSDKLENLRLFQRLVVSLHFVVYWAFFFLLLCSVFNKKIHYIIWR